MDYVQAFNRIMENQGEIALSTSVDNIPNVRIVNFYYDSGKKGVLYFSTFKDCPKTKEFSINNTVAFTSVQSGEEQHVRVHGAKIRKSDSTIYDFKDAFVNKFPDYEMVIQQAGPQIELYEIHFQKATVTLGITETDTITL